MIVFILMVIKIVSSIFVISDFSLSAFSATSFIVLLGYMAADLLVFKSPFVGVVFLVLFLVYFIMWIIVPWLVISEKKGIVITGLSFVIGSNLLDVISCMPIELPVITKIVNVFFCVLIILFSIRTLRKRF